MTRKQRRELGLLPRQVLSVVRGLANEGTITSGMDAKEIAFIVAIERASDGNCADAWDKVFEGTYDADWDEIIRVLEMLIELFLKYLPLFI